MRICIYPFFFKQGNYRQNGGRGRGGNNNHVVNTNGGPTSQTPDSNKVETRRKQQQQSFKAQNMNAITQYSRFKDPALDAMWNNQGGVGLKQRQKGQGGSHTPQSSQSSQEAPKQGRHSKVREGMFIALSLELKGLTSGGRTSLKYMGLFLWLSGVRGPWHKAYRLW